MQLGLIGLGKMGRNMAERLRLGGHQVVGFDFNAEAVARLTATGNVGVSTLDELAKKLVGRRAIWIMVPQGKPVDETIAKLVPLLKPGDILIDGGNSNYKDSMRQVQGSYLQRLQLCRRWHLGRRVGIERGLQLDDRRR